MWTRLFLENEMRALLEDNTVKFYNGLKYRGEIKLQDIPKESWDHVIHAIIMVLEYHKEKK